MFKNFLNFPNTYLEHGMELNSDYLAPYDPSLGKTPQN